MKRKFIYTLCILLCSFGFYRYTTRHLTNSNFIINQLTPGIIKYEKTAQNNESKLYKKRESIDPAFTRRNIIPSHDTKIDLIIPVVERDLDVLKYSLPAARKFVKHKISKVFLVSALSQLTQIYSLGKRD